MCLSAAVSPPTRHASQTLLQHIADDSDDDVRGFVAANPTCPRALLVRVAASSARGGDAAATNPAASLPLPWHLLANNNGEVRHRAASRLSARL